MSRLLIQTLWLAAALLSGPVVASDKPDSDPVARGRYVVMIGGCNDCHTPGFTVTAGKVPESQWLTGDALGWQGAWGTTYAPNLRLKLDAMDVETWKRYARTLTTRPPMPYWAVNAMSDRDLEALWAFVHSLGPAGTPAPAALAPGVAAPGPVVAFPAPPNEAAAPK